MTRETLEPGDRPLVVTTRSRLRGARHFPSVLRASRRVRRQMIDTKGLICGASMTAGPTEFWTITVWRSRHLMQEFTRDGAHGLVMWNYPQWLSSLWLMRWRPCGTESRSWDGVRLEPGSGEAEEQSRPATVPIPDTMPELSAATGTGGVPTYDSSPLVRRARRQLSGIGGLLVRIRLPLRQVPGVLLGLRRLRRQLLADGALLRAAVGIGRPDEVFFLAVWEDAADAERVLTHPWFDRAAHRWPDGFWSLPLSAQGEFGTWDGERLRRGHRRSGVGRTRPLDAGSA